MHNIPLPSSVNQKGMTLVEVMIALLLFTVGVLAVASLPGLSMQNAASARRGMQNSAAAGGHIEQILSMGYEDERLVDQDRGYYPQNPDHGPFAIEGTNSTVEWEVQDNYPAPRFKRITITIRWPDRGGAQRSFSYGYVKTKDFS